MLNRWREPRIRLTAAAVAGAVALAIALAAGQSAALPLMAAAAVTAWLAAGSLLTVDRRAEGHGGWRYLAAGAILWPIGAAVRTFFPGGLIVSWSFADLLMFVGVVLLVVGCAQSGRWPSTGRGWARYLGDTYLIVASLFVISWVLVLGTLHQIAGGGTGMFILQISLPMGYLLLTGAVVLPVLESPSSGPSSVGRMGLGVLAAITVSELAVTAAQATQSPPPVLAGVLMFSAFAFLVVAPFSAGATEGPKEAGESGVARRGRPLLTLGPLLLVALTVVVMAGWLFSARPSPLVMIVAGSIVIVLLLRSVVLVTDAAAMRRRFAGADRQLRDLAEHSGDVVLQCDPDGTVLAASDGLESVYGYRAAELTGQPITDFVHPEDLSDVERALAAFMSGDRTACRISCRVRGADGTWRPAESVVTRYRDDRLLVITRDISDQVALRHEVTHLTFHDGLTGLPNRAYFEECVGDALERGEGQVAVLFIDLDGFTAINDSVGHASGDYLLGQAARRIRSAVPSDEIVARWGSDEFTILAVTGAADAGGRTTVVDLAERLVRSISAEPFRVAGRDLPLTASVGVALADSEDDAGELIRNADVAMTRAKERGGHRVEVFAAHMHADVLRRLELSADLRQALAEHQFAVEYQPMVDLATSRVTAVEALVRWWRGSAFVPPSQFIGAAEDTGLMVPLGEWILRESCREVAKWRSTSWEVGLSVNLSARQITAPRFVETISNALRESGLPASALTLEVTEEMLVEDVGETVARLSELRQLGVRLAIDDFGTGYASLAFLRQLPVDMIKIDPSFVSGLGRDDTLTLLTRTIVGLGKDLGLIVVAEGIERPEQLELLREMGCARGQGYLVARPMGARRVESLMRAHQSAPPGGSEASIPLPS